VQDDRRIVRDKADLEWLVRLAVANRLDLLEVDGVRIARSQHEPIDAGSPVPVDPADPYSAYARELLRETQQAPVPPSEGPGRERVTT
jgi:hypothetical protein